MSEFRKVTSKELIIKHGIKEFLERGFKSASLRSIVKKAGLTTGAFYNYYSSKEELFNELVDPYERHFINVVEKSCDDAIASAKNDKSKANVLDMVSAVYPVDDAADAFKALAENDGSLAKVLIEF